MGTLNELVQDNRAIEDLLLELGGDMTDENLEKVIDTWVGEITSAIASKADSYKFKMDATEKYVAQLKENAAMFSNAASTLNNFAKRLKDRLKMAMIEMGKSQLDGNLFVHKLSKAKSSLKIEDENKIPRQYFRQVISEELDKDKLRNDLENGLEIPGAYLEDNFSIRTTVKK